MNRKTVWLLSLVFVLSIGRLRAEDPTSKFLPLSPLASSLPVSTTGNPVQFEVWNQATAGSIIFSEPHTVDTDAESNISNDTGFADLLLGRPGGLVSANFPAGSSRYLDVTQSGLSVLAARVPLYASAFAISAPNEIPGNLTLVNSTGTTGNILKDGAFFLHNFGTNNTFLGVNAGNLTMTGVRNTANGENALSSNTTGALNTATGFRALRLNTTGVGNTANGAGALSGNTTGMENTAVGTEALVMNINGYDNSAIGYQALLNNTNGIQNTANGFWALKNNTGGNYNTASGIAALASNTTGQSNTANGSTALWRNTTGEGNTASGENALQSNTTGSANTAIGWAADVAAGNLTNATAIGYFARVNASNKIRLGNADVTVIEGQVAYTFTSDKNQKENFQPVEGEQVLRKISGLNLTSWNYIGHDPKQFRHYGPVAQEFFGAFGHDAIGTIGNSTTINSGDMVGILMVAVQALEKRTRQENESLKTENAELKARLEAIERRLHGLATK